MIREVVVQAAQQDITWPGAIAIAILSIASVAIIYIIRRY